MVTNALLLSLEGGLERMRSRSKRSRRRGKEQEEGKGAEGREGDERSRVTNVA